MFEEKKRKQNILTLGVFLIVGFLFPILVPEEGGRSGETQVCLLNIEGLFRPETNLAGVFVLLYPLLAGVGVILAATAVPTARRGLCLIGLGVLWPTILFIGAEIRAMFGDQMSESLAGWDSMGLWVIMVMAFLGWLGLFVGTRTRAYRPSNSIAYGLGVTGALLHLITLIIPAKGADFGTIPLMLPLKLVANEKSVREAIGFGDESSTLAGGLFILVGMGLLVTTAVLCLMNSLRLDRSQARVRASQSFLCFIGGQVAEILGVLILLFSLPTGPYGPPAGALVLGVIKSVLWFGCLALLLPVGVSDLIVERDPRKWGTEDILLLSPRPRK